MSQLIQLRRRIKAIRTTKKVTFAMRMVSIAAYSKLNKKQQALSLFREKTESLFSHLVQVADAWQSPLVSSTDATNSSPLIIIITATRGLCGSFDSALERHVLNKLELSPYQSPTFITIGKDAPDLVAQILERHPTANATIAARFAKLSELNVADMAQQISSLIFALPTFPSLICTYSNTFINLFVQRPKRQVIAPLSANTDQQARATSAGQSKPSDVTSDGGDYTWEQSQSVILEQLAEHYVQTLLLQILSESILAEDAARFMAMDAATTSAQQHVEALSLKYNKLRQSLITREVIELSASLPERE